MEKNMASTTSKDNTKNRTHKTLSPDGTEITGCGHFSPWFSPEPVAREIVRFFSRN